MQKSLKNFKANGSAEQASTLMEKYGNMSEDALMSNLLQEVASQKSAGTFDYKALYDNMEKLRPLLTPQQRDKLDHLFRLIGE